MNDEIKTVEFDLRGFVCPLSKMIAAEAVDALKAGETLNIVLGDTESLKSVAQELKDKGIKPAFKQEGENRFVLTITK
jgi:TusA-related sulfurtransferase